MENDASSYKKAVAVAVGITVIGTILVILHYRQISNRTGVIVIPAGGTYLGQSPVPKSSEKNSTSRSLQGHIYPYTFEVPVEINLVTFPNDPYDMYAISGKNITPSSNVLIGIDTKVNPNLTKREYIQNWWKQFGALTGVASIEPFTNSKGLKGYTVKFLNAAGQSSNVDVFIEVPDHPEYVIHLSNGILTPGVFSNIVDSVGWEVR